MELDQLLQLDRTLQSTWHIYTDYVKKHITNEYLTEAIRLLESIKDAFLAYTSSNFVLYAALAYAYNQQPDKALDRVKEAHTYGYKGFWQFDQDSHGWGNKESEDYRLLAPLHKNAIIQSYVRSVYNGKVEPWGNDMAKTPFCWFEKATLNRKNTRCAISNQKIEKGQEVYQFRFFNGSFGIPTEFSVADIKTFDAHQGAVANLKKYKENGYQLSDYNFKVNYNHPLINAFWHNLDLFDLQNTLHLITVPPVHPSPYVTYQFDEKPLPIYDPNHKEYKIERKLNYGTGGEFIDLLYILIKCGFGKEILSLLPQLPTHFPITLLCFQSDCIRRSASEYLGLSEMPALYDLALKNYVHKTPADIKKLMAFGEKYPVFRKNLAASLNYYEYHLYSNYRPGINWFFQDFQGFVNARGGGLLDFLATEPTLIPALQLMKEQQCYLKGLADGVVDAYKNSFPFLYRTLTFHLALTEDKHIETWLNMPSYIRQSSYYEQFKKVHKKTVQTVLTFGKGT